MDRFKFDFEDRSGTDVDEVSPTSTDTSHDWKESKASATRQNSDITIDGAAKKRILWSALVPGLFALVVTLGAASAFLIWLYVTRITIGNRCDYFNKSPSCPHTSDKVLFTFQKVNIILTVSKIVDLAQSTAASCVMMLAAFRIAQAWSRNMEHISLPEYAELLALGTSGRLWALMNSIVMLWRRRRRSKSTLLLKAVALAAFGQIISHATSLVDIWLHESTVSEFTAAGSIDVLPESLTWSRGVNTSCSLAGYNDTAYGATGGPCSIFASAIGTSLQHPVQAYQVLSNTSLDNRVANVEQANALGIPNLSIVLDACSTDTEVYMARTVGISTQCKPVSSLCGLFNVPHGGNSFNCSQIGFPNFATGGTSSLDTWNDLTILSAIIDGTYRTNVSSNDTSLNTGFPSKAVNQYYLGAAIKLAVAGSNPDSQWVGQGVSASSAPQTGVELVMYCSMSAYHLIYSSSSTNITIHNYTTVTQKELDVLVMPITVVGPSDTISQTTIDAQDGNSTTYATAFAHRLSSNAMAIGAGGTLTKLPLLEPGITASFQQTTIVSLRALFSFLALIYIYAFFILVLLVSALTCSSEAVVKKIGGFAESKNTNLTRLAQLRITDPAFVVHQLLGRSSERAKETFVFDLWDKEERERGVKIDRNASLFVSSLDEDKVPKHVE